uniref:Uncharacterized protein n=1 Tax=Panagrolaimus davidi TaxID=227884 RepID=A0A914NYR7_9BILA
MTASANGSCIITILQVNISSATNLELSHLKTDSLENVKFVAGVDPKFPFFEFNSKTASSWTKLYFYGVSNSFIIPNGSTLKFKATLRLDFLSDGYADNNVKKGIIPSKSFASPWDKPKNTFDLYIKNNTICFMTVKFLDLSSSASLNVSVKRFLKSDIPDPM